MNQYYLFLFRWQSVNTNVLQEHNDLGSKQVDVPINVIVIVIQNPSVT